MLSEILTYVEENALLIALIWMLLANVAGMGPRGLKVAALVLMLVTGGLIIPAVIKQQGWILGLPIVILMLIQLRWTRYFIARLMRNYGLLPPEREEN